MKTTNTERVLIAVSLTVVTLWTNAADRQWKLPPETAKFKAGPGSELAVGQCLLCHSADYVSTQPLLSRVAWSAGVQKMREKYGAPISTNQVEALVDYLVKNYGIERPR